MGEGWSGLKQQPQQPEPLPPSPADNLGGQMIAFFFTRVSNSDAAISADNMSLLTRGPVMRKLVPNWHFQRTN